MLSRRALLGSAVAAPFVVRAGLLMPVSVSTRLIAPWGYPWELVYQGLQGNRVVIAVKNGSACNWVLTAVKDSAGDWFLVPQPQSVA